MAKFFRIACMTLCALLYGCGGGPKTPTVPPPEPVERPQDVVWAWGPEGIQVALSATADLNLVDGLPHAVTLCLYQMKSVEPLTSLAATREGLTKLLQCRVDPAESVKATQRYVQPGEEVTFVLDRADGARFIAVVAGFDHLNPQASFRTAPIPMHGERDRTWYLMPRITYSPGLMQADIHLDAAQIELKGAERVF